MHFGGDGGGGWGGSHPGAVQRGRSPTRDRATPTSRDTRKYARLFLRVDQDRDGYISNVEFQELAQRSGLANGQLEQIWYLVDTDYDGYLSWQDFVAAMHLIRRGRAGGDLPDPQTGLPPDLQSTLQYLERPEALAAQHSRGASVATSAADDSWGPTSRHHQEGGTWDSSGFPSTAGSGFPDGASGFDTNASTMAPSSGMEDWQQGGFDSSPSKKKKDKKKNKDIGGYADELPGFGMTESSGLGGFSNDFGMDRSQQLVAPEPYKAARCDGGLPEFGHSTLSRSMALQNTNQPIEHIEALLEADKRVTGRLRQDVDQLHEELTTLEEACGSEDRERIREKLECERIDQERQHLVVQLEASRRQLGELKVEHQELFLESILLRSDHDHYAKEVAFLQKLLEEGKRDIEGLQQSVDYLELSNQSLLAHSRSLAEARREVADQLRQERHILQQEKEEAQKVTEALAALRSGGEALARAGLTERGLDPMGMGGAQPRGPDLRDVVSQPWHQGVSLVPPGPVQRNGMGGSMPHAGGQNYHQGYPGAYPGSGYPTHGAMPHHGGHAQPPAGLGAREGV